jgi:pyruvate kinase
VSTTYADLAHDARPGDQLLVDDGLMSLSVSAVDGPDVICKVVVGGKVSNNKGLSMPGMHLSVPALAAADVANLEFALRLGVDFVALSFVRSPDDLDPVHEVMDRIGRCVPVIAKIEKPEAVDALTAIVSRFDAVMVARGDLGVEMPLEQVPMIQKRSFNSPGNSPSLSSSRLRCLNR